MVHQLEEAGCFKLKVKQHHATWNIYNYTHFKWDCDVTEKYCTTLWPNIALWIPSHRYTVSILYVHFLEQNHVKSDTCTVLQRCDRAWCSTKQNIISLCLYSHNLHFNTQHTYAQWVHAPAHTHTPIYYIWLVTQPTQIKGQIVTIIFTVLDMFYLKNLLLSVLP